MFYQYTRHIYRFNLNNVKYYHSRIIDHYENPRNVGSFDSSHQNIATAIVGAPACGDVMKLQIKVDDNDYITDAKFKTFGCGSAIASSSYTTVYIIGKHISDAKNIKNTDIANYLKLPPVKLHCSMLAEDSVKLAIQNYNEHRRK
jgi:nitrogen fixation NifU-like protein